MFTVRYIKPDELSTLEELKEEVFMQCGEDAQLPQPLEFKMGYFRRSQKLWINNRQDLHDARDILCDGERLVGTGNCREKVRNGEGYRWIYLMTIQTWLTGMPLMHSAIFMGYRTCAHRS